MKKLRDLYKVAFICGIFDISVYAGIAMYELKLNPLTWGDSTRAVICTFFALTIFCRLVAIRIIFEEEKK